MALKKRPVIYNLDESKPHFIINDIPDDKQGRELLDDLVFTALPSTVISSKPSCYCGQVTHLSTEKCSRCKSYPIPAYQNNKDSLLWLESPDTVDGLIHPAFLTLFCKAFTKPKSSASKGYDIPMYLLDTRFPTVNIPDDVLMVFKEFGIKRGYNYFCDNYMTICDILLNNITDFGVNKRTIFAKLRVFIDTYKNFPFIVEHLPIYNKTLMVFEKVSLNTYIIKPLPVLKDVCVTFIGLSHSVKPTTYLQNIVGRAMVRYARDLILPYTKEMVEKKSGLPKSHIFSTKGHQNSRAVITLKQGEHDQYEVDLPWAVQVTMYTTEILSKLIKRGYGIKDSIKYIHTHTLVHDILIEDILAELLSETGGTQSINFQRYPTTTMANILNLYHRMPTVDTTDMTFHFSPLMLKFGNSDCDGDMHHLLAVPEVVMQKYYEVLRPEHRIIQQDAVDRLAGYLWIPPAVLMNMDSFINKPKGMGGESGKGSKSLLEELAV